MSKTNSGKRKFERTMDSSENKKSRTEVSKNDGKFTEDNIPDGIFSIGDDVFVMVSSYYDSVSVHIRRFKKYGKTYYPTSEGITLAPWWIEYIMDKKKVPDSPKELLMDPYLPKRHVQIISENFSEFTFKRIKYGPDKEPSVKEIIISREQWTEMIKNYNNISAILLDKMFKNMKLLDAYKLFYDGPIEKTSTSSLDNSLGEEYLLKTLKKSMCDIFIEYGMKQPETIAEELWGNRIETLNSFAFSLGMNELAERFHSNLWDTQTFLLLKPVYYVTIEFFKNLRLDLVLREVRDFMCPPDCFEYFEDHDHVDL